MLFVVFLGVYVGFGGCFGLFLWLCWDEDGEDFVH